MTNTETWQGRLALMAAHCAGMVALVAMPVWVGTLMARYGLGPQQAGGLVTLFLGGAVAGSLLFASLLNHFRARLAVTLGYAGAALVFAAMSQSGGYGVMALMHALAGVAAGSALSFTHGTIGRSANPHRLFAIVNIALGIFAVAFLTVSPKLVSMFGGPALFWMLCGIMAVAAVACALTFPVPSPSREGAQEAATVGGGQRLAVGALLGAIGVGCLSLMNATVFSFVERIGVDRGFSGEAVAGVLIAIGITNLFPAPLAVLLERRIPARVVVLAGTAAHALLALVVTRSTAFLPYAAAACVLPGLMLFVHNFAFGLLARLDPSGRVLAATPAMIMAGAALGPLLGGTVVKLSHYGNLGLVFVLIAPLALIFFALMGPAPAAAEQAA